MQTITITCSYKDCGEISTGQFRGVPGRYYYDCPKCKRAIRLKEVAQKDGPTLLIAGRPPRENRGMIITTLYLQPDIKAELSRMQNYSEYVNLVLAKALGL